MAWTTKPAKGTYILDTGSAYKPTHLWMFDEGSSTSQPDIGTGTALNATLVDADQWSSDGEVGAYIVCADAAGVERYAYSATGTLGSTNFCGVVICKSATAVADSVEFVFGQNLSTSTLTSPYFGLRYSGDEKCYRIGLDGVNSVTSSGDGVISYDNTWHMIAFKVETNKIAMSTDGAAWSTAIPTLTYPFASGSAPNRYSFGARVDNAPDTFFDGYIAAAWAYEDGTYADWDDTWISTLYNSQNPWAKFLTTPAVGTSTMGRCIYILP